MSVAKKQLFNQALGLLGEPGYDSIDQDPPPPKLAKVLANWEGAVEWTLRRHPWLCAMTYLTLDPAARDGNWKFPYVFDLPNTCARIWVVDGCTAYEAGSDVVAGAAKEVIRATGAGPLNVAFTEAKPLEAMTSDVIDVMAYELAARCAGPIKEEWGLGDRLHQRALEMVAVSAGAEAGEHGGEEPLFPSSFAALRASAG